jgi:uncharacterized hydrophobic protein (TIGR00271 family)
MTEKSTAAASLETARLFTAWRRWWRHAVVETVDQAKVIETRRNECAISPRYLFMLAMSAGIAVLGLLLSSPAVVIGAMLLSPLMDPIIGLGFALAVGDYGWVKAAMRSLAVGTVLAVALCALIVVVSPIQTVTTEIASRTRPNLFDLLVALFSALAGSYAMIRGREGTIVGVAIATALMPPLAVVGFGLATWNWTVFSGALMLYGTNLLAIALTAAVMARLYGFRTTLSDRHTLFQTAAIVASFIVLSIPLAISLHQIAWETRGAGIVRSEVMDAFDNSARLSDLQIDWDLDPIRASATVLTPKLRSDAESLTARRLLRELGTPIKLSITQYRVGTTSQAAEEAQLAAARAREAADVEHAEELATRLALIAGVPSGDVLVDREHRRAIVTAMPLDGASLGAYRELERRIASGEPEWNVALRPPARPMPDVMFEDGEPSADGRKAIDLIAWAASRIEAPVILAGAASEAEEVRAQLVARGVAARVGGGGRAGTVIARWGAPDDQ